MLFGLFTDVSFQGSSSVLLMAYFLASFFGGERVLLHRMHRYASHSRFLQRDPFIYVAFTVFKGDGKINGWGREHGLGQTEIET